MSKGMLGNLSLSVVQGPRNDLDEKLAGSQGAMWLRRLKRFLRGENTIGVPKTFKVTTDGRSGERLIVDLEAQGDHVDGDAKGLLRGQGFIVTNGVTYKLGLIRGDEFEDEHRTNQNICAEALKRGYLDPTFELAPYVREMFSDEDMEHEGLWGMIIMHQPVIDSLNRLLFLGLRRRGRGGCWLDTFDGKPDRKWDRGVGFLFLVPSK